MTVSIVLNAAASSSAVTSLRTGTTTGKPALNDWRIILATANPRPGGHSSGSSISNVTDPTSHGPTRRGGRGITLGSLNALRIRPLVLIGAAAWRAHPCRGGPPGPRRSVGHAAGLRARDPRPGRRGRRHLCALNLGR